VLHHVLPNDAPKDAVFSIDDNKKWWAAVTKEARVKDMRWHDLRHTFCSRLVQRGVNLKVVQEAAGHLTIQTTAKYAHLDKRSLHEAMTVLNVS
jgi:site-specific recombinase XerD